MTSENLKINIKPMNNESESININSSIKPSICKMNSEYDNTL